jgi:hypothetical protein
MSEAQVNSLDVPEPAGTVSYVGQAEFKAGEKASLALDVRVEGKGWSKGARVWLGVDISQECGSLQTTDPKEPGYVTATLVSSQEALPVTQPGPAGSASRSVDWLPEMTEYIYLVEIEVPYPLAAGEIIRISIGEGEGFKLPPNSIDQFHFWVLVDPSGELRAAFDPVRGYFRMPYHFATPVMFTTRLGEFIAPPEPLPSSPSLRIVGREAEHLHAVVPSLVTRHQPFSLRVSAADRYWNPTDVTVGPLQVWLKGEDGSSRPLDLTWNIREGVGYSTIAMVSGFDEIGVFKFEVQDKSLNLSAETNSIQVVEQSPDYIPYWGDLHSMMFNQRPFSDFYKYARDMMGLDFCAGMRFSYNLVVGTVWDDLQATVEQFHEPGQFVTFHAVECGITSGGNGHKNVYFIKNMDPPFLAELRPQVKRPTFRHKMRSDVIIIEDLDSFWAEIKRREALVMCHHTVEWTNHNPRFERCSEVYSKWGRCEYAGNSDWFLGNRPVQEALAHGLRVGIVAGCDTHDSRSCNPAPEHFVRYPAGVTAIYAKSLSREDLWEALWARRTCATTGKRIAVAFRCGDHWMGEEIAMAGSPRFNISVLGTAPIRRLAIIRDNETIALWHDLGPTIDLEWEERELLSGTHYYYVRVTQVDGNMAWSSPIWVTRT